MLDEGDHSIETRQQNDGRNSGFKRCSIDRKGDLPSSSNRSLVETQLRSGFNLRQAATHFGAASGIWLAASRAGFTKSIAGGG